MKYFIKVILLLILQSNLCFGQIDSSLIWQNTIGGNGIERGGSIVATNDGSCVIAGYSDSNISGDKTENSNGAFDYWIFKLSNTGEIEWQNTIGGDLGDILTSIITTQDGGYILSGYSSSGMNGDKTEPSIGDGDFWIVKIDSFGLIEWQNTIGGNGIELDPYIIQTPDLGYLVGGSSTSDISGDKTENSRGQIDFWVLKLSEFGDIEWQRTIGGSGSDELKSLVNVSTGGYLIAGNSSSNISGEKTENRIGQEDYWILKIDNVGNIEWQNTIGGASQDILNSVSTTSDGGYIIGGHSYSDISGDKTENAIGGSDFWILKLNNVGDIEWQNTIGGSNIERYLATILETTDGGYLIGGYSSSDISGDKTENSMGGFDYWLLKLTNEGEIDWQNTIGGNEHDFFTSMALNNDDEILLAGYSWSDISGDKTENNNGGSIDYWIIKHSPEFIPLNIYDHKFSQINCFPNPTEDKINLQSQDTYFNSIKIYSTNGNLIMQTSYPYLIKEAQINVSKFSTGIYTVVLSDNYKTYITKFMKN